MGPLVGIVPDVRGLGGPASFHQKLVQGLASRNIQVTYDLKHPSLTSVLVIAGSRHLGLLTNVRRKGIPIIQRLNGMNWVHRVRYTGIKHFLRSEINNWILQYIRKNLATKIVYQSRFSQQWWDRVYKPVEKPIRTIYNGVDLERYSPSSSVPEINGMVRVMVVEGHLKNGLEQGLYNAACALSSWHKYGSHGVKLVAAGDIPKPVRKHVEEQIPGRVEWLGILPREQIADELRKSHLFFSVEMNPACPNSVIEALACGLPVIAYESGAIKELVPEQSGIILPYGSDIWRLEPVCVGDFPIAGNQLMDGLHGYRRFARETAVNRFGLNSMVDHYLDVLLS
jgi:glycosyltransferase involved in cell wall biosynthesis